MRFYICEMGDPGFIRGVVALSELAVRELDDERLGGRPGMHELSTGHWGRNTEAMTREELTALTSGRAMLEAWENGDDHALDHDDVIRHRLNTLEGVGLIAARCKTTRLFLAENRTVDELVALIDEHLCQLDEDGVCLNALTLPNWTSTSTVWDSGRQRRSGTDPFTKVG